MTEAAYRESLRLPVLLLTPFFWHVSIVGQAADAEWTGAGSGGEEAYWASGPEEASQPMELWEELAELRQQVIFKILFRLVCLGSFFLDFQVCNARRIGKGG